MFRVPEISVQEGIVFTLVSDLGGCCDRCPDLSCQLEELLHMRRRHTTKVMAMDAKNHLTQISGQSSSVSLAIGPRTIGLTFAGGTPIAAIIHMVERPISESKVEGSLVSDESSSPGAVRVVVVDFIHGLHNKFARLAVEC